LRGLVWTQRSCIELSAIWSSCSEVDPDIAQPHRGNTSADTTISTEGRNAAARDPTEFSTKKLTGTEVPAKFEQGGFTSGRREGPQTLFPGTSPGNRAGGRSPPKLNKANMNQLAAAYHSEFLLARLQKPQCSRALRPRIERQRYRSRSAQPSLRYFTQ
jgi:hypothetical protein